MGETLPEPVELPGEEAPAVKENPSVLGHVEEEGTSVANFLGCLENRREERSGPGLRRQKVAEAFFDRSKLIDPAHPAVGQRIGDEEEVKVGIGPGRVTTGRAEDRYGDQTLAVDLFTGAAEGGEDLLTVWPEGHGTSQSHRGDYRMPRAHGVVADNSGPEDLDRIRFEEP